MVPHPPSRSGCSTASPAHQAPRPHHISGCLHSQDPCPTLPPIPRGRLELPSLWRDHMRGYRRGDQAHAGCWRSSPAGGRRMRGAAFDAAAGLHNWCCFLAEQSRSISECECGCFRCSGLSPASAPISLRGLDGVVVVDPVSGGRGGTLEWRSTCSETMCSGCDSWLSGRDNPEILLWSNYGSGHRSNLRVRRGGGAGARGVVPP